MSTNNYQSVNTNYYVPIQPGLKINTGCYIELKPTSNSKNQNIVLFHQFRLDNPSVDWLPVLPDGCIEIVFCCNPNNPTAYIYGSLLQKKHLYFQTGYDHFGIRFLPEHGFKILSYSMRELVDIKVPLIDIFSKESFILHRIAEADSFQGRIEIFSNFLRNIDLIDTPKLIQYSVQSIYLSRGNISINELAEETGYTDRYLRKKFREVMGISPKEFSQIIRFQNSLNLVINGANSLVDVANELGYYDQAHLNYEFKKFKYMTPFQIKSWLQQE